MTLCLVSKYLSNIYKEDKEGKPYFDHNLFYSSFDIPSAPYVHKYQIMEYDYLPSYQAIHFHS